jgi:hypothetical protein
MLQLELSRGRAILVFTDGELSEVRYDNLEGQEAFFAILCEEQGRFRFISGRILSHNNREPEGDFMSLLLEGLRRLDEQQVQSAAVPA